jgi:hypothetical protein
MGLNCFLISDPFGVLSCEATRAPRCTYFRYCIQCRCVATFTQKEIAMTAHTEALVPTERDVLVAKEFQRQIGGMKFGRKESVAVQIEG